MFTGRKMNDSWTMHKLTYKINYKSHIRYIKWGGTLKLSNWLKERVQMLFLLSFTMIIYIRFYNLKMKPLTLLEVFQEFVYHPN